MREEYDRAKLLDEVWAEPMMVVAPRYGLSDVGLKKLCTRLQVPTPTRGHWAKVKSGRGIPPKPRLKLYKGNPRYLLKPPEAQRHRPAEPEVIDERLAAVIAYEQNPANLIKVPTRGTHWHPLVAATRDAFHATYKDSRGLPLPGGKGINIAVSTEQRPRALRIANALVRAIEKRGFTLVAGKHHLEVEMFGVGLALNIFEATKRSDYEPTDSERAAKARGDWSYWPRYRYTPSGCLEIRSGGYGGSIKDGPHQVVEDQLNKLIMRMAKQALHIVGAREEWARAEERKQIQRREALAQKAIQDAEKEKLEALKAAALRWQQAQAIRAYLAALEQTTQSTGVGLDEAQQHYIAWAWAKADWLDPLVLCPDAILDQKIEIPY
ncbi:TPA: hypothetical protein L5606_005865 [Pseudomonas aeruginosa]|nr:hypothetical protein [Pseudomonas aeruginosa]